MHFYPCCPNEPWPTVKFRIYLSRASLYYTTFLLVPAVILSLTSFAVFFMSFQVGERLGLGVTLVLAVMVSQFTLTSILPVCGEILWLEVWFTLNLVYTLIPLIESCIVLGIAYNTEEYVIPPYLTTPFRNLFVCLYQVLYVWGCNACCDQARVLGRNASADVEGATDAAIGGNWTPPVPPGSPQEPGRRDPILDTSTVSSLQRTATAMFKRGQNGMFDAEDPEFDTEDETISHAGRRLRVMREQQAKARRLKEGEEYMEKAKRRKEQNGNAGGGEPLSPTPPSGDSPLKPWRSALPRAGRLAPALGDGKDEVLDAAKMMQKEESTTAAVSSPGRPPTLSRSLTTSFGGGGSDYVPDDAAKRLVFFESFFFRLDRDGAGNLSYNEVRRMLAFVALDLSDEKREAAMRAADADGVADGRLNRREFVDLCVSLMFHAPFEDVEAAAGSYVEFREALQRRLEMKWRRIANLIDRYCRFWVPLSYIACLGLMGSINLSDHYDGELKGDGGVTVMNTYQKMIGKGAPNITTTIGSVPTLTIVIAVMMVLVAVYQLAFSRFQKRQKPLRSV